MRRPVLSVLLVVLPLLRAAGPATAMGGNVVGVFFDPEATVTCAEALPDIPVQAYVCLLQSSASDCIDGWELRIDVQGDADVGAWQLEHSGLNVFPPPEFQVATVPPDRLPAGPVVVLARFTVTPRSTAPVAIFLGPISLPTLPGYMAFIRDGLLEEPLPMQTLLGDDSLPCAHLNESVWPCASPGLSPAHETLAKLAPGAVSFSSPAGGGLLGDVLFAASDLESLCVHYDVLEIARVTLAAPDSVVYAVRGTGETRVSTLFRDLYRFVLADSARTAAFAEALAGCPAVKYAAPTREGEYASLPDDPLVNPYLQNEVQPGVNLDLLRLWGTAGPEEGACGFGVAVLDEGVQTDHPDLSGRVVQRGGEVVSGHATALAGIVTAVANNGQGIAGLTNCPVHNYVNGGLSDVNVAQGLLASCAEAYPDPVAVALLGAAFAGSRHDHLILQNACDELANANRLLVAAAGNHGASDARYPASYPGVVGVGGIGPSGVRWAVPPRDGCGSALGQNVEFVALADSIWVLDTDAPAAYRFVDEAAGGTSYAAAQVAGVAAAVLKQAGRFLFADDVVNLLRLSASTILPTVDAVCQTEGFAHCYGHGLPQVAGALVLLSRSRLAHASFTGTATSVVETPLGLVQVGNLPWDPLASGTYYVTEYRHERDVEFPIPYPETPDVWGVGCASTGGLGAEAQDWSAFSAKLDCRLVSAGPAGCRLATSVYKFEAGGPGGEARWWPSDGATLTWGWSVLGVPEGTDVEDKPSAAPGLLLAVSPTPFNARARLAITSAHGGQASLAVYDVRGRLARDFGRLDLVPGVNQVEWDGRDDDDRICATGVYLVQCRLGQEVVAAKLLIVK